MSPLAPKTGHAIDTPGYQVSVGRYIPIRSLGDGQEPVVGSRRRVGTSSEYKFRVQTGLDLDISFDFTPA